jgi:hypothetical protein
MPSLDLFPEEDQSGTVFRDVIMLALCGFVAIVLLLLPHLNPPATAATESITPPGNVIVEARWPDHMDTDVDLWVEAPGDAPVGYSNKGGTYFNLLRDDLGHLADAAEINYEVSYSRGIPSGEYTINVHLYRNLSGIYPVTVKVVASVKKTAGEAAKQILTTEVELRREGEEFTAFRFRLDSNGALVPGSVHNLAKALRSAKT